MKQLLDLLLVVCCVGFYSAICFDNYSYAYGYTSRN